MDHDESGIVGVVRRMSRLTEVLMRLPAVPTHDWSQRAAADLASISDARLATATVCTAGPDWDSIVTVEDTGASLASAPWGDRAATLLQEGFGWRLTDPAHWTGVQTLVVGDHSARAWPSSTCGRSWLEAGVEQVLVGAQALGAREHRRVIVVEIGRRMGDAPSASELAMLSEATRVLGRRALLAFGSDAEPASRLTPREEEVLSLLTEGRSIKQIAEALERSPHTVHDHVKSLHGKLDATSRGKLVARALGGRFEPASGPVAPHENGEAAPSGARV